MAYHPRGPYRRIFDRARRRQRSSAGSTLLALCFLAVAAWMLADRRDTALPLVQSPYTSALPAAATPPRNCTQARALGLQDIPRGSPYYASWLDADGDGLACEPW